jgi:hypothetical protein
MLEKLLDQRRLAGADLARDHGDRRPREDAVFEDRVGAAVQRRPEDEVRIRQQREGTLPQIEVVGVEPGIGHHRQR